MPYRIEKGTDVLLEHLSGAQKTVVFDRTVDFTKKELVASPMEEHNKAGIPESAYPAYPWGFRVENKWSKGEGADDVRTLYADEVRSIRIGTPKKVETIVVQGSKNNQYTVELSDDGDPISCTCPVNRYRQKACKHMRRVAQRTF